MSLIHNIALTFINTVGHIHAKNLLSHFGTSEAVFKANKKALMEVPGIGSVTATEILKSNALQLAAAQLLFIKRYGIKVLFYTDNDYPHRLRHCFDAPVLLYYKGNADLNHARIISVVGTRKATEYGRVLCKELAEILAPYNVLVISGLAYGIDIMAHKESLSHKIPTIGVLAHGLDRIYPLLHKPTAQKMLLNGGLLTEFPLNTVPDKENFPKRNRIIAGIADVTIVVEASLKGGALITADIANSYNRDVYAFPGRTTDLSSAGCNFLIKTNRAALVNHAKDIPYYLGWELKKPIDVQQMQLPIGLCEEELRILGMLKNSSARVDELAAGLEITSAKLAMYLLNLEMLGILIALPGKVYKLN